MRELEHANLWDPPPGTRAVVIPVVGWHETAGQTWVTPMNYGYAAAAKARWSGLPVAVGVHNARIGSLPHPLTLDVEGRPRLPGKHARLVLPKYHLVSLPVRRAEGVPMELEYLSMALHHLHNLCEHLPQGEHLREGTIVLPQLQDAACPWPRWKNLMELWLPEERYVVISGQGHYV
jgi:hypothetical protein